MKSEQSLSGEERQDQAGRNKIDLRNFGESPYAPHGLSSGGQAQLLGCQEAVQFGLGARALGKYPAPEEVNAAGTYIETYTGRKFNALLPMPDAIHIKDIAHALSMTCRFAGMSNAFYSVAEHSVLVADRLPDKYKLWGLLHDASEAYIGDMPSPFKKFFADYKEIESNILKMIVSKYGLDSEEPEAVKVVDKRMLHTEARTLIPGCSWLDTSKIYPDVKIMALPPQKAEELFLFAFSSLYKP